MVRRIHWRFTCLALRSSHGYRLNFLRRPKPAVCLDLNLVALLSGGQRSIQQYIEKEDNHLNAQFSSFQCSVSQYLGCVSGQLKHTRHKAKCVILFEVQSSYFLNTFSGFRWVYLSNCLASLCPEMSATSGTDIPISKNLETASCLKSWNRKSVMPTLFRVLFHARRRQVAEIGNTCSSVWGTVWRTSIHLLVRGSRLSSPFLVSDLIVMGMPKFDKEGKM